MVTKAKRQRSKPYKSGKPEIPAEIASALTLKAPWDKPDPVSDLCGEPFHPVAIYLTAAAIAFAGGLGLGWAVWA